MGGNADEGWTRRVLEQFAFGYDTLYDADIKEGKLGDYDVLLIPSDPYRTLTGPDDKNPGEAPDDRAQYYMAQPPEYRCGLGKEGAEAVARFAADGGRLLAFEQACDFAIGACGLRVKNIVKDAPKSVYSTHGSTFNVNIDTGDPAAYGMPEKALILQWDAPVFEIEEKINAEHYKAVVSYSKQDMLESGALDGGDLIAGKPALVRTRHKSGEVLLYGFSPQWRAQAHGTYKLLFNMLYK